jgi:hypothetical protein
MRRGKSVHVFHLALTLPLGMRRGKSVHAVTLSLDLSVWRATEKVSSYMSRRRGSLARPPPSSPALLSRTRAVATGGQAVTTGGQSCDRRDQGCDHLGGQAVTTGG